MTVFCPACRFYNAPLPGHTIGAASGAGMSPGQLEAARELLQLETEQHDAEDRRVNEQYRFDYKPRFHAWCSHYTATPAQIDEATRHLLRGDDSHLLALHESGRDVIIDAVNGKVRPVYALCLRKNQNGTCTDFSPREQDPR